jgi:hypothetical protein
MGLGGKFLNFPKDENIVKKKKGKREYLDNQQTRDLLTKLNYLFQSKVEIPRIKIGQRQTMETLINEEAMLFGKYLRNERQILIPRLVTLS